MQQKQTAKYYLFLLIIYKFNRYYYFLSGYIVTIILLTLSCITQSVEVQIHHRVHFLVGFIGDPAGQLNTSANSGELATVRTLQEIVKNAMVFLAKYI